MLPCSTGPTKHTIHLADDLSERWPALLARLGTHRASKACLYLTRLTQVDRSGHRAFAVGPTAAAATPRRIQARQSTPRNTAP